MKRILSIIIIFGIMLSFAACGKEKSTPISLNGTDISKYRIVTDTEGADYNLRAAEYIRDRILEVSGKEIDIVDDSFEESEYEIVVANTSREISRELDCETEGVQFSMLVKGGSVALEGDYFIIAAAAYYFCETYLKGGNAELADGASVHDPITAEAKNFILLIGDGMGVYQTKLFDYLEDTTNYSDGEDLFYGYMLPYHGFSRTNSFDGTTDSAAGGTALSTGYKTTNKSIGIDRNGQRLTSITELAAIRGMATAVMSTENKTGATPASFSAHANDRDDTSEILKSQLALMQEHSTVIECNFDYYDAKYLKNSIEKRITSTLDKIAKDEDGFFIMYEEAHIDKHSHKGEMEKTFKALIRFNQAIGRFMEFAFYNPGTVVIITADHETGNLLPGEYGALSYNSEEHSSADVPIFAYGLGAEVLDGKTVENIEIPKLIAALMGEDSFGDPSDAWKSEIYPDET